LAWLAALVVGLWAGAGLGDDPGGGPAWRRLLARAGALAYFLGLTVLLSLLLGAVLSETALNRPEAFWEGLFNAAAPPLFACLGAWLVAAMLLAWLVKQNLLLVQGALVNRLVRCYLGASQRRAMLPGWPPSRARDARRADPLTGFDPEDDLPLTALRIGEPDPANPPVYQGPYLLITTSLRLPLDSGRPDGEVEPLLLAPGFCGSPAVGYWPRLGGATLTLGAAAALSGAGPRRAGSFHAPLVSAFLQAFTLLRGAWLTNPRYLQRPDLGLWASLVGLLRRAVEPLPLRSQYLRVTDGTRADPLGMYELVRRRCRYLIVFDAGVDADLSCADLGQSLRRCRTDLGVRVELDPAPLRPHGGGQDARWHCALGRVRYDELDPRSEAGTLLYIKPVLTGDEPPDVCNYAARHPDFPHEADGDQLDDGQWESYRVLGLHLAHAIFGKAAAEAHREQAPSAESHRRAANQLFTRLQRQWLPVPPNLGAAYREGVGELIRLQEFLAAAPQLQGLTREFYPELGGRKPRSSRRKAPAASQLDGDPGAELHVVQRMLRVMELAWFDLRLGAYHAHPVNSAWMNLFRRWAAATVFRRFWPLLRGQHSQEFLRFCEQELHLRAAPARAIQLQVDFAHLVEKTLGDLAAEFALEWPGEVASGRGLIDLVTRPDELPPGIGEGAPVWLLVADADAPSLIELKNLAAYVCGIVLLSSPRGLEDSRDPEFELLVWVRGTYRNLGFGRQGLGEPYRALWKALQGRHPQGFTLSVRYPTPEDAGQGDSQRRAQWLSFFRAYGFRPRPPAPPPPGSAERSPESELVLQRRFRPLAVQVYFVGHIESPTRLVKNQPTEMRVQLIAPHDPQPGSAPRSAEFDATDVFDLVVRCPTAILEPSQARLALRGAGSEVVAFRLVPREGSRQEVFVELQLRGRTLYRAQYDVEVLESPDSGAPVGPGGD
jgi:hypothetical protein